MSIHVNWHFALLTWATRASKVLYKTTKKGRALQVYYREGKVGDGVVLKASVAAWTNVENKKKNVTTVTKLFLDLAKTAAQLMLFLNAAYQSLNLGIL